MRIAKVEGRRVWIQTAYADPGLTRLKTIGVTWDHGVKLWWCSKAKLAQVEALIADLTANPPAPEPEDPDSIKLVGKARYKKRLYYARFYGNTASGYRARLVTLDGKHDFWANAAAPGERGHDGSADVAVIVKSYQPREYRGRTEYTTLGYIQRFVQKLKADAQAKRDGTAETKSCWECGRDFTEMDARVGDGDWNDSYCGC